jgi:type I restriction enzyme M protein
MVKLKGKSDIGDKINTQIIQPLIDHNSRLARSDFPPKFDIKFYNYLI